MSWGLLLWLLALCALLALVVQLLRFVRADADLTLLWAEWQGRRPGEDALPPLCTGSPGSVLRSDFRCPSVPPGGVELPGGEAEPFSRALVRGGRGWRLLSSALVPTDFAFYLLK